MRIAWLTLLTLAGISAGAETVINRCMLEDGTVAFQETPCAEPLNDGLNQSDPEEPAAADDSADFVNPLAETQDLPARPEPVLPTSLSQGRVECEKTTRDAIDAIEFEMRKGYTKEEGQQYLAELLELTQQLRACKQL